MPTERLHDAVRRFRWSVMPQDDVSLTDGQLLGRFVEQRDEAAFASIVHRHGPMVWGVCLRVLHDRQDAEDAFQAAFLVLVLKAASVVPRERVGGWLHGVARQTALRAGAAAARRRAREKTVKEMPEPETAPQGLWDEVLSALDQEVDRLPDKYRLPVVLCDLEGKTRNEVARQLGWPEGTVAGRLARGRTMLAKRLRRYDPALVGGVPRLAAPAPAGLMLSTMGVIGGSGCVPASVAALAAGVLKTMQVMKLAAFGTLLLAFAVVAGGSAVVASQACRPAAPTPQLPRASSIPDAGDKPEGKPKAETEKDDDIVWGKAVGGLQAGITFKGGRRSYRIGEVVPIVVRLRNVTDKTLAFDYSDGFFVENPPTVTDAAGKPAKLSTFPTLAGLWRLLHLNLTAGQTVDFGSLDLALVPANGDNDSGKPALFAAPGTHHIHYERMPPFRDNDATKVLSTGKIDLEVKAAEPPAKAMNDLEGRWQAVSFDQDGRVPLGVDVKDVVATFLGDKYHFTTGLRAKGAGKGKLAVHTDTDPKSFEFTPDSGVFEGMAFRGIYRLKDDTLTLCFSWPPINRPSEFTSPPNSTVVLAVFKPLKP